MIDRRSWFSSLCKWSAASVVGVASLLANVDAPARERQYTAEEALQAATEIARAEWRESEFDTAAPLAGKSLSNGLYMTGTYTYSYVGSSVTLTVGTIENDSYTRTSGTLRLELWATSSMPSRGVGFTGYKLATSSTLAPLSPRSYYSSVSRTSTFSTPPDGTYWMVLVLTEYSSSSCTSSDSFCVTDSLVFPTQRTFGTPPPTNVTITAPSVGLCVENYPSGAATLLQQSQPGVWLTHPASTSCASLGMSFYAGNLPEYPSLRVYTASASTAQSLCSSGLVINCTVTPAAPANYSDLWWNPSESGWGVSFTQHTSGIAFVAWYTYDSTGKPKWYVATNCRVIGNGCSDTLYETTGPPFGTTFDPSRVTIQSVGSVTFSFSSATTGTMSYSVRGVSGTKAITRQPY